MNGFICSGRVYKYKDTVFEISGGSGPWPLRKDGNPNKRAGNKFFALYSEFSKLTAKEKEACRIGGGCRIF